MENLKNKKQVAKYLNYDPQIKKLKTKLHTSELLNSTLLNTGMNHKKLLYF